VIPWELDSELLIAGEEESAELLIAEDDGDG
jgi:hypothetical protein